jgi:Spy/CpxP family protein refolding chaperone
MTIRKWTFAIPCLILATAPAMHAQGPRGGFFPWWNNPIANGVELTDAQRVQIRSVTGEYRGRMMEVRDAVRKAESDLDAVFNEDTVDQRKGSEAIERLTKARGDMTRAVAEMSLRMRAVLTPQQWQDLRQQAREARRPSRRENAGRGSAPPQGVGGRGRRGIKSSPRVDNPSQPAPALTPPQ